VRIGRYKVIISFMCGSGAKDENHSRVQASEGDRL
jgi:hypothetical protein